MKTSMGVGDVEFRDEYESFLPELKGALSRLGERLWEGSKNATFLIDDTKKVLDCNIQAAKVFSFTSYDKNKRIYRFIPSLPENAEFYRTLSESIENFEMLVSRANQSDQRGPFRCSKSL